MKRCITSFHRERPTALYKSLDRRKNTSTALNFESSLNESTCSHNSLKMNSCSNRHLLVSIITISSIISLMSIISVILIFTGVLQPITSPGKIKAKHLLFLPFSIILITSRISKQALSSLFLSSGKLLFEVFYSFANFLAVESLQEEIDELRQQINRNRHHVNELINETSETLVKQNHKVKI